MSLCVRTCVSALQRLSARPLLSARACRRGAPGAGRADAAAAAAAPLSQAEVTATLAEQASAALISARRSAEREERLSRYGTGGGEEGKRGFSRAGTIMNPFGRRR